MGSKVENKGARVICSHILCLEIRENGKWAFYQLGLKICKWTF